MNCPACDAPHDPGARLCAACGRPLGAGDRAERSRRTVTVVFGDLAGSTTLGEQLDPEALREVMLRYYALMRDSLERHGGTVEKFIGDAVMAVFGVPRVREDDVLRGVRAAWDMQRAMAGLDEALGTGLQVRLRLRVGVNTGEVLYSREFGEGHAMVSGDTVNVAARLQQHAPDGGILLGEVAHQVVAPYVTTDAVKPLTVKGKSRPLLAWRLLAPVPDPHRVRKATGAPLVGRAQELRQLEFIWERCHERRACHLFTLLGDPGVGKSRLAAEFSAGLRERGAAVATVRSQPYGGGGMPQILADLIRQLLGQPADEGRALRDLLTGPDGTAAARLLGDVVHGAAPATEMSTADDIFWATGRLLAALGADRPICVVLDDLQWAQPTLLDLIDHLADWTAGIPLLLLCPARVDLLDLRPQWGSGKLSATSLVLGPLSDADCEALVAAHAEVSLHGETAAVQRVVEIAEGNPLFAEQLVEALTDGGSPDELPPTIQALLEARLDRLPPAERHVLEHASVVGREFAVAGLRPLEPAADGAGLTHVLQSLVRRGLVEPAGRRPGEAAYRFVHLLVREVCYAGLAKRQRARLHQQYARRLETVEPGSHGLIGRHLAEAHRHHRELGPWGPVPGTDRAGSQDIARPGTYGTGAEVTARLAADAARHLRLAGEEALARGECSWAAELLAQGAELAEPDAASRLRLAEALIATGAPDDARELLTPLAASHPAAGSGPREDPCPAAHAQLLLAYLDVPGRGMAQLVATARRTLPVFSSAGDELGRARARLYVAHGRQERGGYGEATRDFEAALEAARRSGATLEQATALGGLAVTLWLGPEPAPAGIARCRALLSDHAVERPAVRAALCCPLAVLLAMRTCFAEARNLVAEAERIADELGVAAPKAAIQTFAGQVETLAGEGAAAERRLRLAREIGSRTGDRDTVVTATNGMAAVLLDHGRVEEAGELLHRAGEETGLESPLQRAEGLSVRAWLAARHGDHHRARRLAADAVDAAARTDSPVGQALALLGLARVAMAGGEPAEGRATAERAARAFTRKGHLVGAGWAARLRDGAGPR
ncbi:ATP-binding protein [Streptomyces klenkii]|uniref:ATP-binding protein n=1 Tax=Streptomyces klenkii TaxID=1420899 RepID=UPI00343508F2